MTQTSGTPAAGLGLTGKLLSTLLPLVVMALITTGGGLWDWMLEPAKKGHDVAGAVARVVAYGGGIAAIAAFCALLAYGVRGKTSDALQGIAASLLFSSAAIISLFSFISFK